MILSVLLVTAPCARSGYARCLQPVAAYSFRAVSHGNQCPGLIKQAHFTIHQPPSFSGITCSAIIWLLSAGRYRAYSAQPGVSHLPMLLLCVRRWQCSAAIADRHMGNFKGTPSAAALASFAAPISVTGYKILCSWIHSHCVNNMDRPPSCAVPPEIIVSLIYG